MDKRRKFQGVTAFVGMPGSGKTYSLAEIGLAAMERGERVVCNAGFDLEGAERMSTFDEFAALQGPAVVVWDELPLYFNARKWGEFPDAMLYKFTQIRKDSVQLYYSAIHEMMIDTNIRRITFWYWQCRAVTSRLLVRSLYPPDEFRKATAKPYRKKLFVVKERVAAAYDTDRKVQLPDRVHERIAGGVPERAPWAAPGVGAAAAAAATSEGPRAGLGASWVALPRSETRVR